MVDEWSPDTPVGYVKRHELFDYVPSTKTMYNWIDEGILSVINMDLPLKLRRSTKTSKSRKNKKVLGTSIEERSEFSELADQDEEKKIDVYFAHPYVSWEWLKRAPQRTDSKVY